MGRELPAEAPDTYGLPEYRVTIIIKERVGDEIRMLLGSESFGQVRWWCTCVMKASDVFIESQECQVMALEGMREVMRRAAGKAH